MLVFFCESAAFGQFGETLWKAASKGSRIKESRCKITVEIEFEAHCA